MESTTMRILAFATLVALAWGTEDEAVMVEMVKQNYKASINEMIEDQINRELTASYVYQGYASYFQRADVSLPGIQKFFSDASLEERGHADTLIEYVNKRGGHVQFPKIDLLKACLDVWKFCKGEDKESELCKNTPDRLCICGFVATGRVNNNDACDTDKRGEWKEGLMAFSDALVVERYVNFKLLELHEAADNTSDAHLTHILEHDFLEEQVHAIYELGNYVNRLKSFTKGTGQNYKLGEYIFDEHLQKKSSKD